MMSYTERQEDEMQKKLSCLAVVLLCLTSIACNSRPSSPIADAASAGDAASVASLLHGGGDSNTRNINGFTPLICAAREGRAEIIRMLIESGADPNLGGCSETLRLLDDSRRRSARSAK
jgi:ankyrin repeat protein